MPEERKPFTTQESAELYGIDKWGDDYFFVSDAGTVRVCPSRGRDRPEGSPPAPSFDLLELVREIEGRGVKTPLLIRFSGILQSRVHQLVDDFAGAIEEYDYRGRYRPVYPIKVNQQRPVVEELVRIGRTCALGLEVGSKAELLVALAVLDTPEALIVCNGYKDRPYIEMALLAQRLGREPVVVLDRPGELEMVIKISRELGTKPRIGVRARLAAKGEGKWSESSGERSKFGLSALEIVRAVQRLDAEDMLDCLEMLHFHIGSQITAIRAHKAALREAAHILVGLHKMGARIRKVDVGGGLAVDYDGSKSNFHSSMNYTSAEYAMDVVAAISEACADDDVPHPDIVTESGRALVSACSVLVFQILDIDEIPQHPDTAPDTGDHAIVRELYETWTSVTAETALECYHDAVELKEEGQSLFSLGYVDLPTRARIEELFWGCCRRILEATAELDHVPEDLHGLERTLADRYYGNFSVFQSLPDSWTLGQLFPVMPIHRLAERPERRGTIVDLTCDSDGKVDQFIDLEDVKDVLELHHADGRPYYLGIFLIGAYQETLGELHNLFGDTNVVHVRIESDDTYIIEHLVEGDTTEEVLSYVQYDRRGLTTRIQHAIESALKSGSISLEDAALLRRRYNQDLAGYTYLDREE